MRLLTTLGLILCATFTSAQDISIRMKDIGAGSYVVLRSGNDAFSHIFVGKHGKHYIYDVVPGRDPNAQQGRSRYYRDAKGQSTKWVLPDGKEVTYSPHNCQRTIGVCTFVERGIADGKPYITKMIRTNTPTTNGFQFEQVAVATNGTEHQIMSGTVTFDEYGMIKKATRRNAQGVRKFKQVKAHYR